MSCMSPIKIPQTVVINGTFQSTGGGGCVKYLRAHDKVQARPPQDQRLHIVDINTVIRNPEKDIIPMGG